MMTATEEYETIDSLEQKALRLADVEYAVVHHDRDDGSKHFHLSVQLKNAMTITALSKKLDIKPNFIEKWDKRVYNMWAYMLHHTTDAKNEKADYSDYIENNQKFRTNIENYTERTAAKPVAAASANAKKLDELVDKILSGEMNRRQLLKGEYLKFYYQNQRKIDTAIKLRVESLKYNPPNCKTMYIHGRSGTGKTSKAYQIANLLYKDNYTTASSSNDPLQDYSGEKCLIIDDFRPQDYPFIELLALLDPYFRQKTHKSRFYNKPLAAEFIIITSIYSFQDVLNHYNEMYPREEMKQLRRRIQQQMQLTETSTYTQLYDDKTDTYIDTK